MRSFRLQLTLRFTAAMAVALAALMTVGWLALRETLDRQIDASILNVASIQAASVAGDPSGEMEFHEWNLTPLEASSVRDLNRWAQVWSEDGESLLRTQYLTRDLPSPPRARSQGVSARWRAGTRAPAPRRRVKNP